MADRDTDGAGGWGALRHLQAGAGRDELPEAEVSRVLLAALAILWLAMVLLAAALPRALVQERDY